MNSRGRKGSHLRNPVSKAQCLRVVRGEEGRGKVARSSGTRQDSAEQEGKKDGEQRTFGDFSKTFHTHYLIDFTRRGGRSALSLSLNVLCPWLELPSVHGRGFASGPSPQQQGPHRQPGPPPQLGRPAWFCASSC